MSQMTATTAPAPRARRRSATIPPLRLVRAEARVTSSAIPFVLVCSFVLAAGLICLLLLNTALVKGSYEAHQLESRSAELSEREQSLRELLAAREGPQGLAARAAQLGMVQPESTRWLDLATGKVTGIGKPAGSQPQAVVTEPSFDRTASPAASVTVGPDGKATPVAAPGSSAAVQAPGQPQSVPGQPQPATTASGTSPDGAADGAATGQRVAPDGAAVSSAGASPAAGAARNQAPSARPSAPSGATTGAR